MGFLDALAAAGEIGLGSEKARMLFEKDAHEKALREIALEDLKRKQAEAQYQAETMSLMRAAAAKYGLGGPNSLPAEPDKVVVAPAPVQTGRMVDTGDPNNEGFSTDMAERTIKGAPARPDDRGALREQERLARERIADPRLTESLTKARTAMEAEGYKDFLAGIVADQDPEVIKRKFNEKGAQKIESMEKDSSGVYTVTYEDGATQKIDKKTANHLGTALGIFKRDPGVNVPWGSKHINADGTIVDNSKIDPNSQETIDAKNAAAIELAQFKSRFLARAGGASKEPAAVASAKWLAENLTGGNMEEAANIAFHVHRNGGADPEKNTRAWIAILQRDPKWMTKSTDEILVQAKKLADGFSEQRAAPPRAAAPAAESPTPPPASSPEPLGDPALRGGSKDVKIDTPPEEQKSIIGGNGKTYTWNDIVTTAKRRGMTTQEVIARVRKASEATP